MRADALHRQIGRGCKTHWENAFLDVLVTRRLGLRGKNLVQRKEREAGPPCLCSLLSTHVEVSHLGMDAPLFDQRGGSGVQQLLLEGPEAWIGRVQRLRCSCPEDAGSDFHPASAQKAATKIATNDVDVASNPSFQPTHVFMLLPLPWC